MKHSTRNKVIGACIIVVVVFVVYFSSWLFLNNGVQTREGVMRQVDRGGWQIWGIETKKKLFGIPLKSEHFSISDTPIIYQLPEEFKVDGLRVKVKFEIIDIIGMSDWDAVIMPKEIKRIVD